MTLQIWRRMNWGSIECRALGYCGSRTLDPCQKSHKAVIKIPQGNHHNSTRPSSKSHETVILSGAPHRSIARKSACGAESKNLGTAYLIDAVRAFSTTGLHPCGGTENATLRALYANQRQMSEKSLYRLRLSERIGKHKPTSRC